MCRKNMHLPGCAKQIDNCIWISLLEFNGLVKIDIDTGYLSFVGRFPAEDEEYQLHFQISSYDNKLVFCPWNTNNIAIYDIELNTFRKIPMKNYNCFEMGRFLSAVQEDENLYFISENAKKIVQFDIQKETVKDIYILPEEDFAEDPFYYVMPMRTHNDIWKISEKKGMSWRFNITSKTYKKIELLYEDITIYTGCSSNDYIWLLTENTILYQFTSEGMYFKEYDLSEIINCSLENNEEEREHFSSIYLNNNIFFIWYGKKRIIRIPIKENIVCVSDYQIIKYDKANFSFDDKMIISEDNKVIIFDGDSKKEVAIEYSYNFMKDVLRAMENKLMEKDCSCMKLWDFILFSSHCDERLMESNFADTSGNIIHRMMV